MSRIARYGLLSVVLLGLACNLITQPISDVQNLASTAQALGSQAPELATMMANSTGMPDLLGSAVPPGMPDPSKCLDITDAASASWNDIPVMPDATAGSQSGEHLYCYTTPSPVADIQKFYEDQLGGQGWTLGFAAPEIGDLGMLTFEKDSHTLLISILRSDNVSTVSLTLE